MAPFIDDLEPEPRGIFSIAVYGMVEWVDGDSNSRTSSIVFSGIANLECSKARKECEKQFCIQCSEQLSGGVKSIYIQSMNIIRLNDTDFSKKVLEDASYFNAAVATVHWVSAEE